jgi:hypothetical protein
MEMAVYFYKCYWRLRNMTYLVAPKGVTATEATVWIGVINEKINLGQLVLKYNEGQRPLGAGAWEKWKSGTEELDYQHVLLQGLSPRKTYSLQLLLNGEPKADGKVTTLPDRLPALDEKPFTVLLGSCFCRQEDDEGMVGKTYFHLPAGSRPDVKILSGDQVYLDHPWFHYLWHTHSVQNLRKRFFTNYQKTWAQQGGFQQLLKDGANFFTSDDHELWNNAPNTASFIRDTWPVFNKREEWYQEARTLYGIFQTSSLINSFPVGTLSFLIADTRMNRDADQKNFMKDEDLERVGTWVSNLKGPGVLVVGQPVLRGKTGFFPGHFGDWSLADFAQYGRLVRLLTSSKHSVVILTGDVHFGRIAQCTLSSGSELIEIISSPMSLVDRRAEGTWEEAPGSFPAVDIPGIAKIQVQTLKKEEFSPIYGHFLTLEFSAVGPSVTMAVRVWPIMRDQGIPSPDFGKRVYQRFLH